MGSLYQKRLSTPLYRARLSPVALPSRRVSSVCRGGPRKGTNERLPEDAIGSQDQVENVKAPKKSKGFSSISAKTFKDLFNNEEFSRDLDLQDVLSKRPPHQLLQLVSEGLVLAGSFIALLNEACKYFFVYEMLRAVATIKRDAVVIPVHPDLVIEAPWDKWQEEEESSEDSNPLPGLADLAAGMQQRISGKNLAGPVEFVISRGANPETMLLEGGSCKIQCIIEVKHQLVLPINGSTAELQMRAQMLEALYVNSKQKHAFNLPSPVEDDDVWGLLTDLASVFVYHGQLTAATDVKGCDLMTIRRIRLPLQLMSLENPGGGYYQLPGRDLEGVLSALVHAIYPELVDPDDIQRRFLAGMDNVPAAATRWRQMVPPLDKETLELRTKLQEAEAERQAEVAKRQEAEAERQAEVAKRQAEVAKRQGVEAELQETKAKLQEAEAKLRGISGKEC